jgi:hypothetical protein
MVALENVLAPMSGENIVEAVVVEVSNTKSRRPSQF